MPFTNSLQVVEHDIRSWKLLNDLHYQGDTDHFTVPAGYVTDFASVPDSLVWLLNKTGPYTRAAVVHDWLITDEIPAKRVTSRDTDGLFRRIMREEGVPFPKRWVMWAAVRMGALFSPGRAYGRQFYRDAPLITLIAVLSLPIVPATLLVLITRTLLRPLR